MSALGLAGAIAIGVALGLFGGGGSILTVPLLVYAFGLDVRSAIATSLLVVAVTSAAGAVGHARVGRVDWRAAAVFGGAGMLGAHFGGRANAFANPHWLMVALALTMIAAGAAMLRSRTALSDARPPSTLGDHGRLAAIGLAVGTFTGLIGAGGGFLITPALMLWAGLSVHVAIGTSLVIIAMQASAGLAGVLTHESLDPTLTVGVSAAAITGVLLGTAAARRVAPAALRRGFAAFVLLVGAGVVVAEGAEVLAALPIPPASLAAGVAALLLGAALGRTSISRTQHPARAAFVGGAGI